MDSKAAVAPLRSPSTMRERTHGVPRVLIVGGGFGGLYAARELRAAPVAVTVIDRTNHHLFQPLLYQVAMALLAPSDITSPIRHLLRKQRNTDVLMADVRSIDAARHVVVLEDGREIGYDYLIVATGARHSYFGHDGWERIAPGLKSIDDAREIRRRYLLAFERAEASQDPVEQRALLTFVIVGGGPTGVELAGIMPEVTRRAIRREFRHVDTRSIRVILVEAGSRVLPTYPEGLSARAKHDLEALGVEVRTNTLVTNIEPDAVYFGDERIATRTVIWAAGNVASPLARSLGVPLDRVGRVIVEPDLSIPGHAEVFVVGDLALTRPQANGKPAPGVAQGAMQGGRQAANNICLKISGRPTEVFRYRNKGDLATIGRHKAVGDLGFVRITGRLAWWFWLILHILYLAGFRNRLSVLVEWGYAYFTFQRGSRLLSKEE